MKNFIKNQKLICYVVFILCSLSFISLCFNENVWLDEAFTATLVHTNFSGVIERSMADTLPPLYNILLWATTSIFGYSIYVMKLTSVLPMILTLLLGATIVRKHFSFTTSLIFMLCITGMPLMYYFGVEIRMYSLGFFFATASAIYSYLVVTDFNKKNCILFGIFSALAGYSHHFAFVAVGFVYLFLLLYYFFMDRSNIVRWFKCLAITIVLYIPCGLITLKQLKSVSGYFTMPDVTLSLFIQYALYPFSTGFTPVSLLLLLLVVVAIINLVLLLIKKEKNILPIYAGACFLVYYGVLIFGTIISKIMTANIFVDRYLFFSTGMIALSLAILIPEIRIKNSLTIGFAILIITLIASYSLQFKTEYNNSASEELAFIKENFKEGDFLYTVELQEELQYTIPFYALYCGIENFTYYWDINSILEELDKHPDNTVWVIVQDGYELSDDENKIIQASSHTMDYALRFDFDRYGCDLYQIN